MQYLTFSEVFRCLYDNADHSINPCRESAKCSQSEFFNALFYQYTSRCEQIYDNSHVGKFSRNERALPDAFTKAYAGNIDSLYNDVETYIIPWLTDYYDTADKLYQLIKSDTYFSSDTISEICKTYPCESKQDSIEFIARAVYNTLSRPVSPAEPPAKRSNDSFIVEYDLNVSYAPPPVCKYFCGRDDEFKRFNELIEREHHVFVTGLAGIGKSEFAKAYAKHYGVKYKHVLYFSYNGSLLNMISELPICYDTDTNTFSKNNKLLRSLGQSTLIIIDDFNVPETKLSSIPEFDAIKKYRCDIIFTSRCRYDHHPSFELGELSDDILFQLVEKLFPESDDYRDMIKEMIGLVDRHTYSVEIIARLMAINCLEPSELIEKLRECSINPDINDEVETNKDSNVHSRTYYSHIHFLFSLFELSESMQYILRCASYIPSDGIKVRQFKEICALKDLNDEIYLEKTGFIKRSERQVLSVHPMIKEITRIDLKPSAKNCANLIEHLTQIFTESTITIPNHDTLFDYTLNLCKTIIIDDIDNYFIMAEQALGAMNKYNYSKGFRSLFSNFEEFLDTLPNLPDDRKAVLYLYKSIFEMDYNKSKAKALTYAEQAVELSRNGIPHLQANMLSNLSNVYTELGRMGDAKKYNDMAISMIESTNEVSIDLLTMYQNRAFHNIISGRSYETIKDLLFCADVFENFHLDTTIEYADIATLLAKAYSSIGNFPETDKYVKLALNIYRKKLHGNEFEEYKTSLINALVYAEQVAIAKGHSSHKS